MIEIFVKYLQFGQKSKFKSLTNFGQKKEFCPMIEILVKYLKLGQKYKFWSKI